MLTATDEALFCRATRTSFLRLLTQKIAPGYEPLSNPEAWETLDALMTDSIIGVEEEPYGLDPLWRCLSGCGTSSPKVWMDAYLAAFAIAAGMRLVAFDRDFRDFEAGGLDLVLLRP